MTSFLLGLIFVSAALSLVSYVYCWHDIRGGRPHIISLRQILTIMDRNRINEMFGAPEPGYYYPLSPAQLRIVMQERRWFYTRECTTDIVCLVGSWLYMTGGASPDTVYGFILLAGLCQGINVAYSLWLIRKWSAQIREELDNTGD